MEFSSRTRRPSRYRYSKEKYLSAVILPAIRDKTCSICLTALHDHRRTAVISACLHAYCLPCIRRWSEVKRRCPLCNVEFDSWHCRISLSSRKFVTEKLLPTVKPKAVVVPITTHRRRFLPRNPSRTCGSLPWLRTFSGAEGRARWRASIYDRCLRAVPIADCAATRKRVEPWIRRELQAVLEDPDPSVIVHIASSLLVASLEQRSDSQSGRTGVADGFLAPLRPFLRDRTEMFWHELSFAASPLNMETYDQVVKYVPLEEFDETTPRPRTSLRS
ncbi:E3 ubiquitin-protein ligase Topors [Linum grandiflorum]